MIGGGEGGGCSVVEEQRRVGCFGWFLFEEMGVIFNVFCLYCYTQKEKKIITSSVFVMCFLSIFPFCFLSSFHFSFLLTDD